MGKARHHYINLLLLLTFIVSAPYVIQAGSTTQELLPSPKSPLQREIYMKAHSGEHDGRRNWRRLMIGSTAPTCTYNECRGCKNKCRAEQVPVEGNDPANSAYHYRCVCQR